MSEERYPVWAVVSGIAAVGLLLPVLVAWYYLGTDILIVYLEQGLSYCF